MENKVINIWTDGGARGNNVSVWAYVGYIGDDA